MLKELRLTNIVLVESLSIPFADSFNVLSGESGSGKSAIMNALNLIAGDRCDTASIRRGEDKGAVEAVFDISNNTALLHLLDEAGIACEKDEDLLIKREINTSGKSRAFINNQVAQAALLKQVSSHLFEVVGQHANQKLLSLDYHRRVLDLFGDTEKERTAFANSHHEEVLTREALEQLVQSESQRLREIESCKVEIEELEESAVEEGEEEEVFAEFTQLANADEIALYASEILNVMEGERMPALSLLGKQRIAFEKLLKLSPHLAETATTFTNALVELGEVARTLRLFTSSVEPDPARLEKLNKRLEVITLIKRKYGPTVEETKKYLADAKAKLAKLENTDADIEKLRNKLEELSLQTNTLAAKLTAKRKEAAGKLEKALIQQLCLLNMPKVEFTIELAPQKRHSNGDDKIEFFLTPNIGEHRVSLRECASGGELSRIMLAIQALMAGKEHIPTLVFDEIDSNIGGETAVVVGQKLKEISQKHQVLCITHFYQVAKQAEHHLKIYKKEIDGRTITLVDALDDKAHEKELVRMLGG